MHCPKCGGSHHINDDEYPCALWDQYFSRSPSRSPNSGRGHKQRHARRGARCHIGDGAKARGERASQPPSTSKLSLFNASKGTTSYSRTAGPTNLAVLFDNVATPVDLEDSVTDLVATEGTPASSVAWEGLRLDWRPQLVRGGPVEFPITAAEGGGTTLSDGSANVGHLQNQHGLVQGELDGVHSPPTEDGYSTSRHRGASASDRGFVEGGDGWTTDSKDTTWAPDYSNYTVWIATRIPLEEIGSLNRGGRRSRVTPPYFEPHQDSDYWAGSPPQNPNSD